MEDLGMKQYVQEPTRVTYGSETMATMAFANMDIEVQVQHTPKITDHSWIQVTLKDTHLETGGKEFIARDSSKYSELHYKIVFGDIIKMNEVRSGDVHAKANRLVSNMIKALDQVAPRKKFKIPSKWAGKKWYSEEVRKVAAARDKAYIKARYKKTEEKWSEYRVERNNLVKLMRKTKKDYYEKVIDENRQNPIKIWKSLKEILRGVNVSKNEVVDLDLELDATKLESNISVADKFNINIVYENEQWLDEFKPIDIVELQKIISKLPKKTGTEEEISSSILKTAREIIQDDFIDIINTSFKEGQCPRHWKTSTIIPIPKVQKPKSGSDFRPINMLPIYEKVLEIAVKDRLEEHLEANNIITKHQSRFRKKHSCETAIQTVVMNGNQISVKGNSILKTAREIIQDDFIDIINTSFKEGQCPRHWKTSTIIPIPKVQKPKSGSDFRPINMLPIYEKVLEIAVKDRLEEHLEANNIITKHQSRFRKKHSCETAIQTVVMNGNQISVKGK
ncbi:uncharacterized protein LOC107268120 [Cephus cinctus]|uniref:Uncharacterized protein LOC107268120 n=1 Tax=Cephus cinctus TaxID=211228 RepID=A0AAJ7BWD5_CEPCN|nr:uncharacterized protein LOC107268120 [Cephus cinctus]